MTAVALLGTGRMGSAMARALARAGHDLVLWNRTSDSAAALAAQIGARAADTPATALAGAEVAVTMLADRAAVEEVFRRSTGLLDGLRDGTVVLDMSTVEPSVSQSLDPEVRARGASLLDAPVSGSTATAESGQLTVMAGGDPAALERARPVLDALAVRVFHMGPVGTGAAMKLAVNAIVFAVNVAVSEAIVLAERAGIDRTAAYDVLEASVVGSVWLGYKRAAFLDPEGTATAFALGLAMKDMRLITEVGEALGVPLAQARTNLAATEAAARDVGSERDFSWVAQHLRSGVATGTRG